MTSDDLLIQAQINHVAALQREFWEHLAELERMLESRIGLDPETVTLPSEMDLSDFASVDPASQSISELEAVATAVPVAIIRPTHVSAVLHSTDWTLLSQQKLVLLDSPPDKIVGLINWIDAIQDAAESEGYPVVWLEEVEEEAE